MYYKKILEVFEYLYESMVALSTIANGPPVEWNTNTLQIKWQMREN